MPNSYGFAGWLKNDNTVLINDHYDIWKFDLTGKVKPINITAADERKNFVQYRILDLDPDNPFIDFSEIQILNGFNEINKEGGYYTLSSDQSVIPARLVFGKNSYTSLIKAKNKSVYSWRRGSFREFNDLWILSGLDGQPKRISNANPQQSAYLWGDVQLVEWKSFTNEKLQGLIIYSGTYAAREENILCWSISMKEILMVCIPILFPHPVVLFSAGLIVPAMVMFYLFLILPIE